MSGAAARFCVHAHLPAVLTSLPVRGGEIPVGGLPGDSPGDSLLRTSRGYGKRFDLRIVASLDEMTDAGTDVRNDLRQDDGTSAWFSAANGFRSGSRPRSPSRRRFPCRHGSVPGERNDGRYDDSYDARYGERANAAPGEPGAARVASPIRGP